MTQKTLLDAVLFHETSLGQIIQGDSVDYLATYPDCSVDLIMTSPPFGLVRKKDYGNVEADQYVEWFKPFAAQFHRVLKDRGSLVIDIGGSWNRGYPTRSLYHFKLLITLCEEFGFHLAQDFYWWNPSKLPTPAEWVTVRQVRVKDAVNTVWWLSKTPWPKASNRQVLQPYSPSMQELLAKGYKAKKRPSGHDISDKFNVDNGAAIPPNLIAIPNTESNSFYLRYCEERGFKPHPARYPAELPEYFIRMLTEPGDLVVDPFSGSCVTGEVCERTERRWICIEILRTYCEAALGRFVRDPQRSAKPLADPNNASNYYRLPRPGILWNGDHGEPLSEDGGQQRRLKSRAKDRDIIIAFVQHLRSQGFPDLELEQRPDADNRRTNDIDAIAGPFAIEHTSIDGVAQQRRDIDRFSRIVSGPGKFLEGLDFPLTIGFIYEEIGKSRNWTELREALKKWICEEAPRLDWGPYRASLRTNPPIEIFGKKTPRGERGFFRTAPCDKSLSPRIRQKLDEKASKLEPYHRQGKTTVLLVENEDIALMCDQTLLEAIRSAYPGQLPSGVDQVWFADTSITTSQRFCDFSDKIVGGSHPSSPQRLFP